MGKVYIKGGIWKNTEDEILKAAVMKYGINQWSRISSLLVRKSAKQCKARWYEWLHPSIKKTEWSREEDEKLLHLAKIFPTQWRTIAPVIGRTATQCLDRYDKLLSQAEERDETGGDDPRRLRPGEVDPAPETKPARPDPVDMDDDEKEMLAEARARLANTQGKKAKRKAREKQLEEARRLASLQKKRELKAAGIEAAPHRKNTKMIDYNAEIPLYKPAAPGFFDTTQEKSKSSQVNFLGKSVDMIEGKRRADVEEDLRRRDLKRQKEIGQLAVAANSSATMDELAAEAQLSKRPKLFLPAPQVSEKELDDIVKLGLSHEQLRASINDSQASAALLRDHSKLQATPLRTPQSVRSETLLQEAKNLLALQNAQTPLVGGSHPINEETIIDGITPKSSIPSTPSRLKAASATGKMAIGSESFTPRSLLNHEGVEEEETAAADHRQVKQHLKSALRNLPAPKTQVEIDIDRLQLESDQPDIDHLEENDREHLASEMIQDVALIEMAKQQENVKLWEEYREFESQVRQRKLPIPSSAFTVGSDKGDVSDNLIKSEMARMIRNDQGLKDAGNANDLLKEILTEERNLDLKMAKEMLLAEMNTVPYEKYLAVREECERDLIYLPGKNVFGKALTKAEKLSSLQHVFHQQKEAVLQDAKKAAKMEQKLTILLGGYAQKALLVRRQIGDLGDRMLEVERDTLVLKKKSGGLYE